MYRILFHFIYSLFTSFHTKYHTLFSLMKSKSSSLFRSIESNGYFSIIEANIIQYYHSRFKIATIIRGKCEGQTVSLDILISVMAKWCAFTSIKHSTLKMYVVLTDSHRSMLYEDNATRMQDA